MLRELSAHGPATRGSDLLIIETARYGRGFLVSVFGMGCCRPSREYGYLGACAFLFRKRRPGHTDRRLNVASLFRTFGVVTTLSGGREVLPNRMRFGFATLRLFRIFVIGPIDIVNIWKRRTTR